MRYVVRVRVDDISAGHHLPGYPGDCARPHGHNWAFEAEIGAEALADDMVVDFALVKAVFKALDHQNLNDDPEICADGHRPTTERLAEVVAGRLQALLTPLANGPRLLRLTVRETGRNEVVLSP